MDRLLKHLVIGSLFLVTLGEAKHHHHPLLNIRDYFAPGGQGSKEHANLIRRLRGTNVEKAELHPSWHRPRHLSYGNLTSQNLTEARNEPDYDPCSANGMIERMGSIVEDLIPPYQDWILDTTAEELIYMIPCNGLPLTRVDNNGNKPKFGYIAVYDYLIDIFFALFDLFGFAGDFGTCLAGGEPSEPLEFDAIKNFVLDLLVDAGMEPDNPLADFVPVEWVDPNHCVNHTNYDPATSENCTDSKPCCSYDINDGGVLAEFHPVCQDSGICNVSAPWATCLKTDETCTSSGQCCQKEDQLVICQFENENYETGTCQDAPDQPFGWNPFCLAYTHDAFAYNLKHPFPPLYFDPSKKLGSIFPNEEGWIPNFPPPNAGAFCEFTNGFASSAPTGLMTPTVQFTGLGIGWGDSLGYGMNDATYGGNYGDKVPKVWDGYHSVSLPANPGTNFWLALRVNLVPTPKQIYDVAKCKAYLPIGDAVEGFENPKVAKKFKLQIQMDFELYVDGGATGSECIVIAMTDAMLKIKNIKFIFARGIGGWCRSEDPTDKCTSSGFFTNVEPAFDIQTVGGASLLDGFLFGLDKISDAADDFLEDNFDLTGGISFGVFIDNETEDVVSTVIRFQTPNLEVFGVPIANSASIHFQWFKGSELNRRIETLLKFGNTKVCPALTDQGDCTWRTYERWVDGQNIYAGQNVKICIERLFELDHYNRIMTASLVNGEATLPVRMEESDARAASVLYANPKFDQVGSPESDNIVLYFAVNTWANPIVTLNELSLTFILQIEDDIDFSFDPVDPENVTPADLEAFLTEIENADDGTGEIDVYAEIYAKVTVLYFVEIEAAASLQNNVDGQGTYDKWVVAGFFSVDLGDLGCVGVSFQSKPFTWNTRRRELAEGKIDEEEYRRLSRELSAAEPDFTVELEYGCIAIIEWLEDAVMTLFDTFILQPLLVIEQFLVEIGEFLVEAFKDSIFADSTWKDIKDIAQQMKADSKAGFETLQEALDDGNVGVAITEAVGIIENEITGRIEVLTNLATAWSNTLKGASSTFNEIKNKLADGLQEFGIAAECGANPCYNDDPKEFHNFDSSEDDDEYNCPVEKWRVRLGCKAAGWCTTTGDKRFDGTAEYYYKCNEDCQACRQTIIDARQAEQRAEKEKLEAVKGKMTDMEDMMDAYTKNKDKEAKGLYKARKNVKNGVSSLGTPTINFEKVTIVQNGVQLPKVHLKAKASDLPHLMANSDSPSFGDDDLFEDDELFEIDFSPGETMQEAQERVAAEFMGLAKSRAVEKVVKNSKLDNSSLKKYVESYPKVSGQRYYAVCGRSTRTNVCGTAEMLAEPSEHHAIRCCMEADSRPAVSKGSDGFSWTSGKEWTNECSATHPRLYAESAERGGSCLTGDFWTAKAVCEDVGARLCSREEISNDCAAGPGCGFDDSLVWSSTPEPTTTIQKSYVTVCGKNNKHQDCGGAMEFLNDPNQKRAVRCCMDANSQPAPTKFMGTWWNADSESWSDKCNATGVYGESAEIMVLDTSDLTEALDDFGKNVVGDILGDVLNDKNIPSDVLEDVLGQGSGVANQVIKELGLGRRELFGWERQCAMEMPRSEAESVCSAVSARLCTKEELQRNCPAGTGCGMDLKMVWSSTVASLPGDYCLTANDCYTHSCNVQEQTCNKANKQRPCYVNGHCWTKKCNTKLDQPRCDTRIPGEWSALCDDDSDCPTGIRCDLTRGMYADTYGKCLLSETGYYCEKDHHCISGSCDAKNNICM